MDGLKQIMYGVTDFPRMRRENAYFVDRTGLIRELEKTPHALFLRPRRFGKSFQAKELGTSDNFVSFPFVGHGPYLVRHELEANGGSTDIAFHPQLDRWPQIGHAALIELKYLKAKDDASNQTIKQSNNQTIKHSNISPRSRSRVSSSSSTGRNSRCAKSSMSYEKI